MSCLDNNPTDATVRSRLNFINPITIPRPPALPVIVPAGTVVKQITTTIGVPGVPLRPVTAGRISSIGRTRVTFSAVGRTARLYSIDYSSTTTAVDGTTTLLTGSGSHRLYRAGLGC